MTTEIQAQKEFLMAVTNPDDEPLKTYTVYVHETSVFEVEALSEDHAKTIAAEGEIWGSPGGIRHRCDKCGEHTDVPGGTGNYDCYLEAEEN